LVLLEWDARALAYDLHARRDVVSKQLEPLPWGESSLEAIRFRAIASPTMNQMTVADRAMAACVVIETAPEALPSFDEADPRGAYNAPYGMSAGMFRWRRFVIARGNLSKLSWAGSSAKTTFIQFGDRT
jgi:hypothetical protein